METLLQQLPVQEIISFALGFVAVKMQGFSFKDYFKNKKLEKIVRYGISLFVCMVGGLLIHLGDFYVSGEFNMNELLSNVGVMFATSQTFYNTYFRFKK